MKKIVEERIKLIRAMEYVARQVNDEEVFEGWLLCGVADGDIEYGDLCVCADDPDVFSNYTDDEDFADIMACFLRTMSRANKSGGLYCDGILSSGAPHIE